MELSNQDYWELVSNSVLLQDDPAANDYLWSYPSELGQGSYRETYLRAGLELSVSRYQLHQPLYLQFFDREHPIELTFQFSGSWMGEEELSDSGDFHFFGSGLAPRSKVKQFSDQLNFDLSVHIDPNLFYQKLKDDLPISLETLIRDPSDLYYQHSQPTPANVLPILAQILDCPYHGAVKRMYLEAKVWELVAIHLDQMLCPDPSRTLSLKPDDVERIHYAKELLREGMNNPPSLMDLARSVGINDNKLKVGFREVFGTTAFGCLHQMRMEKARQLLVEGRLAVAAVAHEVGFSNTSYFSTAFRKQFGVSPHAYRKGSRLGVEQRSQKNSL